MLNQIFSPFLNHFVGSNQVSKFLARFAVLMQVDQRTDFSSL
jgi:hypothetical protein